MQRLWLNGSRVLSMAGAIAKAEDGVVAVAWWVAVHRPAGSRPQR